MARIVVITRAWPYPPGEQFVGDEAQHWSRDGLQLVVMPWWAKGTPAVLPAGVSVDLCLARRSRLADARALAEALLVPEVRDEFVDLLRGGRPSKAQLLNVVRTARGALVTRDVLRSWIRRNGPIDVVYSYWFDSWTLGALLLKGRGVGHVASRVHGYDLYEERHPAGRHALRRRLVDRLDLLLPVAKGGGEHASQTYGVPPERVLHAPLGVELPEGRSATSGDGELRLVSVASCLPVKRIDRLVDAVGLLAADHPDLRVSWTHLGGGQLLEQLRTSAAALTAPNLSVELAGEVSNAAVNDFLAQNPVDLFVNTSESEGVPVSIMEALAHGIPALAPRVGAMDEILGDAWLLPEQPSPREVADALWRVHERCKDPEVRTHAREVVETDYERSRNHSRLMDALTELAASPAR